MWLIASEASNPFINLRWHLAVMGRKDSTLYLVNGAIATLVFFAFRVALWGYMLTVVYAERCASILYVYTRRFASLSGATCSLYT